MMATLVTELLIWHICLFSRWRKDDYSRYLCRSTHQQVGSGLGKTPQHKHEEMAISRPNWSPRSFDLGVVEAICLTLENGVHTIWLIARERRATRNLVLMNFLVAAFPVSFWLRIGYATTEAFLQCAADN